MYYPYNSIELNEFNIFFDIVKEHLVPSKYFEFGAKQFSLPDKFPFSPASAHYFLEKELPYVCFDAELNIEHSQLCIDIVNRIKNGDWSRPDKELERLLGLDLLFNSYDRGFSFNGFQDYVDNITSIQENLQSVTRTYEQMLLEIQQSTDPLVFSNNTLNYPKDFANKGLDKNFPFWSIKDVFHIHKTNKNELIYTIGAEPMKYEFFGKPFDNEALEKFKEHFELDVDISFQQHEGNRLFLYWQA
jgi:hypothetical protein